VAPHGHAHRGVRVEAGVAVLTVSDSRSAATDRSGARARELLAEAGHRIVDHAILPDEPAAVRRRIESWLAREDCDAVVVSGGTGISSRDRTYEALAGLLDKRLDGFGELFRALSFEQVGSAAMLSRAVGGVARGRLLFSLPGSTAAVELALVRLILPELGHLLAELRKETAEPPPGGGA
jgi:molybdenum cofactor biosynthesis protein B